VQAIAAFQFVSVQEPRLTARLVRQSADFDAVVVLDLEDALWDVADEDRTAELKAQGRSQLIVLAAEEKEVFDRQRIGVRINRLGGPHAAADLATLGEIARRVRIDCVVPTKVESGAELTEWATRVGSLGIGAERLVPIVETVAGLENLTELLATAVTLGVGWLVYGHYDYALDAGWWPFPELDSTTYQRHASPIIAAVEAAGLHFVQPPFFHLSRLDRFAVTLGELQRVCRLQPGAITLGRPQTALAAGFDGLDATRADSPVAAAGASPKGDARALARHVITSYEANRKPTASFSMEARTGEFISPHLYLAALHYLENVEA
jgi:citrate lyase beta subunit